MKKKTRKQTWWKKHWDEVLYAIFMIILITGVYVAIKYPPVGV